MPLLPAEHMIREFERIQQTIKDDDVLMSKLSTYMYKQWMHSSTFNVQNLSIIHINIRKNNDCEGYHNRIRNYSLKG